MRVARSDGGGGIPMWRYPTHNASIFYKARPADERIRTDFSSWPYFWRNVAVGYKDAAWNSDPTNWNKGRLNLAPLVSEIHSPHEAPEVYRRLAFEYGSFPIGVLFDWTRL